MSDKQWVRGYECGWRDGYRVGVEDGWARGFDEGLEEAEIQNRT
jgi:hypothetical protein